MKRHYSSLFLLFGLLHILPAVSQVRFKTVVPQRPLAPGESFQVQYILENADEVSNFLAPQFDGFRVVSGPHVYSADGSLSPRNLVFTLAAINEGRFKIEGASCLVNGKLLKSNDAFVQVVSAEEREESPYFLRAGEDPLKKIQENLFLKLIVDRQKCFLGEPLVATFKLYSRLQSRSNVIKNPGFYGFSVYDMVDVNAQILGEEKLNGHWFQVHTIRKVQLYPLQPGSFTIDPMELANEVEFSKSVVNKKTEQEVTEKMYGDDETRREDDVTAQVYQVNLKTVPLVIKVNPLPLKNVADTFAGAVGNFSINAFVEKDSIAQNEENYLTIKVSGSGNFQRVNAPVIHWPQQFEGFEPSVTDTLNAQLVPLTGERSFRYPFLSDRPGQFIISAVAFSFFNLKTQSFKTVSTKPITILVGPVKNNRHKAEVTKFPSKTPGHRSTWWVLGTLLVLIAVILFSLRGRLFDHGRSIQPQASSEVATPFLSVDEVLKSAQAALDVQDNSFYRELNSAIWNYIHYKLQLSGSQMNKELLKKLLLEKNITTDVVDSLVQVVQQSETRIYTNAEMVFDRKQIFETAKSTLNAVDIACR